MRTISVFATVVLALALLGGCSDRQEEAAELEQEMRDLEAAGTTTDAEATADTMATQETVADAAAVPEETEPAPPTMPRAPLGEGYTVQVASCENQEYARHLIGVYSDRGYEPYVTTITFEGQTYNRVRIGNFDAVGDAKALKAELVDKYSLTPWIDRLDQ